MKHQTELIKHIAALNLDDKPATFRILQRRTLIRAEAIYCELLRMERDGLTETHGKMIYLTESGWAQYERDKPRVVSADMLVSHADGGVE